MNNYFITGVTGTLGKDLVKKLLLTTDAKLTLLIRRKNRYSHWDRIRKILSDFNLEVYLGTRVNVLEGDITQPHFGLNPHDLEVLESEATHFIHVAALTALNGSEEDCFRINQGGTREALKLAWRLLEQGKLQRFFYFSTAYVAGSLQSFTSREDGLPEKPAFANHYEASKYASETLVREAMEKGLPVTIFRPSIVVGHSKTGEVSEFNVIYPFMKLFAHGILSTLPTHLENSFNIVPIDFVIDAAVAISLQDDSVGKTFHLVTKEPPTIGMLLKLKNENYPDLPPISIVPPQGFSKETLSPNEQLVYQMLEPYLGYLNDHLGFDTTNTEKALEGTGIEFPVTDYQFLKTLVSYAVTAGYLVV